MALPDTVWNTVATKDTGLLESELSKIFLSGTQNETVNSLSCPEGFSWDLDYYFLNGAGVSEDRHKSFLNDYFSGKWQGSPSRGRILGSEDGEERLFSTTASMCGIEAALCSA